MKDVVDWFTVLKINQKSSSVLPGVMFHPFVARID